MKTVAKAKTKIKKETLQNKRNSPRRDIDPLKVTSISSLDNFAKISNEASIVEASTNGLLITLSRDSLVPAALRRNLNIDEIIGMKVLLHISQMNIEISGKIARTKFLGKEGFKLAIDYTEDAPAYWRECLVDLLPVPGELEGN